MQFCHSSRWIRTHVRRKASRTYRREILLPLILTTDSHLETFQTSCFNDVILLPLPTWLLLVVGLPLLFSTRAFSQTYYDATATKRGLLSRIITIIYRLLVLALLLMDILEITRLVLSNSGIGLLPFNLAGVLIVMVILGVRWRKGGSTRVARGILIAYWGSCKC